MGRSRCRFIITVFCFVLFVLILAEITASTAFCFHSVYHKGRSYNRKDAMLPRDQGGYAGGHDTITGEAALLPTTNEGRLREDVATSQDTGQSLVTVLLFLF